MCDLMEVQDVQDEFEISSCETVFPRAAQDLAVCADLFRD